jgi:exodeoxyribonuclease V alpha subunit
MATRACCSFAAPSDARGVRAQRVATTKEPRLLRPLPGPVSMRLAARALVSRLAPLGGADALARVGGNACRSRAPVVSATDHRSFGAKSAGADEINSRLTQGTGTTFVHREPPDALRTSRGDTDALDARRASASSAVSASQRQWTSAPTSATSAPRAPIPAPADGPRGPSFELWGPDETSSGSGAGAGAAGAVAGIPPRGRTPSRIESPSFVTLRGEINRVTFHNADNFYTVARVRVAVSDVSLLPIGATGTPAGPEGAKYNKYKKRAKGKGKGKGDTEKVVTVVGHIPGAAEGACLEMTGDWRDVEKWGTQFVLNATPKEIVPTDEESMLRYLAGGVLPGVGKATAEKLVAHFGAAVFETLDSRDAERKLKQCPGIGEKTAEKLARSWQFSRGRRDACLFLEQHGVEAGLAQRVAACYGAQTEQKVTEDPFNALSGIPGATFHRCDALAARLGKAPDAEPRLAAAMLRVLHLEATREGHVFVNWGVLTEGVAKLVGPKQAAGLRGGALEAAADLLLKRGNIAVARNRKVTQQGRLADDSGGTLDDTTEEEETETFAPTAFAGAKTADSLSNRVSFWNSSVVAAAALHDAEASVALDIALRLQKPKRDPDVPRVRRWLQAAATKEGWRLLSPAQEAFLDLALREPISVLTGGPGTGKTFATHIAVRLWRAMGKNVLMCAPTGRAAQRLAEIASAGRNMSAPVQSSTIHRLLEYGGGARANNNDDRDGHDTHQNSESHDELTYKDKFARNAQNPLDADIVVVDESSMLDLPLCAALLDAIKQNAQVSSVFFGRRTTVCLYYYLLDLQYYPDFEPTTSTTLVVRLTTLTLP